MWICTHGSGTIYFRVEETSKADQTYYHTHITVCAGTRWYGHQTEKGKGRWDEVIAACVGRGTTAGGSPFFLDFL
jgi:hypothetical protein